MRKKKLFSLESIVLLLIPSFIFLLEKRGRHFSGLAFSSRNGSENIDIQWFL